VETKADTVSFEVTSDEKFRSLYQLLMNATDLLGETLDELKLLETRLTQTDIYRKRWTIYLGTLFHELAVSSSLLALRDHARTIAIINRQLFEYCIRNRFYIANHEEADRLMHSLPAKVVKEAEQAPSAFSDETRESLVENYREWLADNPGLDNALSETRFTPMAKAVLGDKYERDFLYSVPSILVHGKPHGVVDVLQPSGNYSVTHSWESRWFDTRTSLSMTLSLTIQYAMFVRLQYQMGTAHIEEINHSHGELLGKLGIGAERVELTRIVD
jgi:hypothetical protein